MQMMSFNTAWTGFRARFNIHTHTPFWLLLLLMWIFTLSRFCSCISDYKSKHHVIPWVRFVLCGPFRHSINMPGGTKRSTRETTTTQQIVVCITRTPNLSLGSTQYSRSPLLMLQSMNMGEKSLCVCHLNRLTFLQTAVASCVSYNAHSHKEQPKTQKRKIIIVSPQAPQWHIFVDNFFVSVLSFVSFCWR